MIRLLADVMVWSSGESGSGLPEGLGGEVVFPRCFLRGRPTSIVWRLAATYCSAVRPPRSCAAKE